MFATKLLQRSRLLSSQSSESESEEEYNIDPSVYDSLMHTNLPNSHGNIDGKHHTVDNEVADDMFVTASGRFIVPTSTLPCIRHSLNSFEVSPFSLSSAPDSPSVSIATLASKHFYLKSGSFEVCSNDDTQSTGVCKEDGEEVMQPLQDVIQPLSQSPHVPGKTPHAVMTQSKLFTATSATDDATAATVTLSSDVDVAIINDALSQTAASDAITKVKDNLNNINETDDSTTGQQDFEHSVDHATEQLSPNSVGVVEKEIVDVDTGATADNLSKITDANSDPKVEDNVNSVSKADDSPSLKDSRSLDVVIPELQSTSELPSTAKPMPASNAEYSPDGNVVNDKICEDDNDFEEDETSPLISKEHHRQPKTRQHLRSQHLVTSGHSYNSVEDTQPLLEEGEEGDEDNAPPKTPSSSWLSNFSLRSVISYIVNLGSGIGNFMLYYISEIFRPRTVPEPTNTEPAANALNSHIN